MSRSLKKGPYIEVNLEKKILAMNESGKKNVAFLMHSTGHHPAGSEIDASIIYADYYYLEALMRAKEFGF